MEHFGAWERLRGPNSKWATISLSRFFQWLEKSWKRGKLMHQTGNFSRKKPTFRDVSQVKRFFSWLSFPQFSRLFISFLGKNLFQVFSRWFTFEKFLFCFPKKNPPTQMCFCVITLFWLHHPLTRKMKNCAPLFQIAKDLISKENRCNFARSRHKILQMGNNCQMGPRLGTEKGVATLFI